MAIIINELEVIDRPPEPPVRDDATKPATPTAPASEIIDLAQQLAQLEERRLRVEAN